MMFDAEAEKRLLKTLVGDIKYDDSAEPIPILCEECGKPTGEFERPHAKDCRCWACQMDRRLFQRNSSSPVGKKIEFRKISGIG